MWHVTVIPISKIISDPGMAKAAVLERGLLRSWDTYNCDSADKSTLNQCRVESPQTLTRHISLVFTVLQILIPLRLPKHLLAFYTPASDYQHCHEHTGNTLLLSTLHFINGLELTIMWLYVNKCLLSFLSKIINNNNQ